MPGSSGAGARTWRRPQVSVSTPSRLAKTTTGRREAGAEALAAPVLAALADAVRRVRLTVSATITSGTISPTRDSAPRTTGPITTGLRALTVSSAAEPAAVENSARPADPAWTTLRTPSPGNPERPGYDAGKQYITAGAEPR